MLEDKIYYYLIFFQFSTCGEEYRNKIRHLSYEVLWKVREHMNWPIFKIHLMLFWLAYPNSNSNNNEK